MKSSQLAKATVFWVIWAALVVSILVYAAAAFLSTRQAPPSEVQSSQVLFLVLLGMGFSNALASVVIRQIFLVRAVRLGKLDVDTAEGFRRALVVFVVLWALADLTGVFGLALVFWNSSFLDGLPFWGLALLLMLFHRPAWGPLHRKESAERFSSQPGSIHETRS